MTSKDIDTNVVCLLDPTKQKEKKIKVIDLHLNKWRRCTLSPLNRFSKWAIGKSGLPKLNKISRIIFLTHLNVKYVC